VIVGCENFEMKRTISVVYECKKKFQISIWGGKQGKKGITGKTGRRPQKPDPSPQEPQTPPRGGDPRGK
jgi:hypothetical protein